jgi:outer membrane murein-binding lipoprotein Lpp
MGGYRTEDLHHGEWHDLQLPPPGGFCGLLRSDRSGVRCTEQYGHGWMHRAKVDGVQHTWNTLPASGLNVDQLTRDVKQLRGMVVAAHARVAELEAESDAAVGVSNALSGRLEAALLAGSALYAALTMPTTPEQKQAALDQFEAVASQTTITKAVSA